MSLSLKADKSLQSEVRRVASRYLSRALDALENQPEGPHEAIHTARKQFKRIRSLYRLVASADKGFQKRENERIGTLGRSLAASRDATSLVETAHRLGEAASTAEERMALERIHGKLVARRDAMVDTAVTKERMDEAVSTCKEALAAAERLRIDGGHKRAAEILGHGWRSTGRKAAKALRLARKTGEPDCFHTLRKRTQDRWVHCRFLAEAWPAALNGTRKQARALVTLLGENQDIALLTSFADAHPGEIGTPKDLTHLLAVMIAEGDRLRAEALPLAELLFPEDTREDAGRIELLWRHAA
ncbi:CHAD domain-containing protein [Rhizobium sp. TRM96647]|uniref:CHAD domain-containing protein n=1 Tax=unclassified Rhizobium TaxID=2613769 RepID=UPI0021E950AA|nr:MULTISPECIES: CHAD domain-containing protein [unclassified Rhizobium]MCV3736014.1 CHAD domain-containing protein [Rhizobium sp. TRM96647]MCV3758324.1 CHAD domain-containing protein [Rhizobium sp. TRM96650]